MLSIVHKAGILKYMVIPLECGQIVVSGSSEEKCGRVHTMSFSVFECEAGLRPPWACVQGK